MSSSASRDNRRMSVTREIHHRLSAQKGEARKDSTCYGPVRYKKLQRTGPHKHHNLKRFFSTVPDSSTRYMPVPKSYRQAHRRNTWDQRRKAFMKGLISRVPFLEFIRTYNIKEYIVADLIAGLAATGLHFPQGLAYGLLATLTPAIGMVSTIFPVFIYMIFGSAAHTSIGTNAIVSIMVGDMLVEPEIQSRIDAIRYGGSVTEAPPVINATALMTGGSPVNPSYTSYTSNFTTTTSGPAMFEEAAMAYKVSLVAGVTFYTGLIFVLMGCARMGFLVTYLSQSFMSGFTTGVAVHIFSSQVKTALGVKIPAVGGIGKLIKMYYAVFANIGSANVADIVVTLICVIILLLVKILINERLKLKVPVPIDFILLVCATIISHFAKIPETFNAKALGDVKLGIPSPELPALTPGVPLILCAIQVALVTFFLNISVIKIIARRNGYEINENVETNAYGMCNIISAFFSNIPASIAPPRSSLLSSMGAKTTFNGVSTVTIMLALMFYFGQFFSSCPQAVLASMIMVAMKDLLKQVNVLPKLWTVNKNDFTTWIFAALVTVLADIPVGLVLGVLVSLLSVINQSQRGWVSTLGKSNSEDLYLDKDEYGAIHEIPGIKIVRMESSLYFATAEKFRKSIYKIIEQDADNIKEEKTKSMTSLNEKINLNNVNEMDTANEPILKPHDVQNTIVEEDEEEDESEEKKNGNDNNNPPPDPEKPAADDEKKPKFRSVLIIDCLPINFIDGTGLDMLKLVTFELQTLGMSVYLARCSRYMLHLFEKSDVYEMFPREHVFLDIPDAVDAAVSALQSPAHAHLPDHSHVVEEMEEGPEEDRWTRRLKSVPSTTDMAYDRFMARSNSIFNQL